MKGKTKMIRKQEHDNTCRSIAEDLRQYANGVIYRTPNGDEINIEDFDEFENKDGEAYIVVSDEEIIVDDLEECSIWDYFDDCLDIAYTIGSDKVYRGVRVMVACGGPDIYIDTNTGRVELRWWSEEGNAYIDHDTIEAIDEVFEEYYNC